ncbi:HpcH/HpaI aldolase/citrate lyase family protein [Roseomonas sp. CCTCC AB2023176]|uniref:HpcH/HpaI aldolase family protein n=1 Tax=Roseomonas sp. CCTCC AB2023176 TaxID=3342640 RepID=UPI0035D64BB2
MPRRSFSSLLASGERILGTWAQIPHPESVDILGAAGFDFAIVDLEHGHFGIERATDLLRACDANGLAPVARPRRIADIPQVLDAGAVAVVVPGIESAETARAAVAATRFAPAGTRGACPCVRSGGHYVLDWPTYEESLEASVIALIETAAGAAKADAICATEGLTAVMAGPFDLAVSMGHRGDWHHPEVERAMVGLLEAAARHGVPAILPVFEASADAATRRIREWEGRGVRVFTVGTDKILLAESAARWVRIGRA